MKRICLCVYFLVIGCSERENKCLKDFVEFTNVKQSPAISITTTNENNGCEYRVVVALCLGGDPVHDEGIMTYRGDKISLSLLNPKSGEFVLFDFSYDSAESYVTKIKLDTLHDGIKDIELKVRLDGKYKRMDEIIYAFRAFDFYCYGEYSYDIIYFVTERSGVIGSYISDFDLGTGKEFFMYPSGDYLSDLIDYSKKTEAVLK
jgi:hypothetical protein